MYTEKLTVRVTPEDKEKLQIEADKQKLPLTTYIRNVVSGEQPQLTEFVPQVIHTNYSEYKKVERATNLKINAVNDLIKEVSKLVEIPPKTSKEFLKVLDNPIDYVTTKIYEKHAKNLSFKISKHKLLELMEINLKPLESIYNIYNQQNGNIIVDENGYIKSNVHIDQFKTYTKTNADNERLKIANDLIEIFHKAKSFGAPFRTGNYRDATNPILMFGVDNNGNSILIPCERWVLGKG